MLDYIIYIYIVFDPCCSKLFSSSIHVNVCFYIRKVGKKRKRSEYSIVIANKLLQEILGFLFFLSAIRFFLQSRNIYEIIPSRLTFCIVYNTLNLLISFSNMEERKNPDSQEFMLLYTQIIRRNYRCPYDRFKIKELYIRKLYTTLHVFSFLYKNTLSRNFVSIHQIDRSTKFNNRSSIFSP